MWNPFVTDGILALGVTALLLLNMVVNVPVLSATKAARRGLDPADPAAVALLLVGTLCLVWRRRAPLAVLTATSVGFCAYLASGYPAARPLAPVIALYSVAVTSSSLVTATVGAAVSLGVVASTALSQGWTGDGFDDQVFAHLLSLGAACMLGYGIQLGGARTSALTAQAARLSREHTADTERAISRERSRIARELHDVVAHHVSVITAQAGGAQRIFDTEPERAREALGRIEATGRAALNEMRRLLGILPTSDSRSALAPQPGLDQLPSLAAQTERAGLPVELCITGAPRLLPSGVELNVYRIVQEALTNTLKHAGPARARVELTYRQTGLDVQIRDNGRGFTPDFTPGHGLIGMRERAALLGADLVVAAADDRGVQVTASVPTGARPE